VLYYSLFAQDPFEDQTEYMNEVQDISISSDVNDESEDNKQENKQEENDKMGHDKEPSGGSGTHS
jgi:hypothetical protein